MAISLVGGTVVLASYATSPTVTMGGNGSLFRIESGSDANWIVDWGFGAADGSTYTANTSFSYPAQQFGALQLGPVTAEASVANAVASGASTGLHATTSAVAGWGNGGYASLVTFNDGGVAQVKLNFVNSRGQIVSSINPTTSSTQVEFGGDLTKLANGNYLVTWYSAPNVATGAVDFDLNGAVVTAAGALVGSPFLVNTTTVGGQGSIWTLNLGGGGIVTIIGDGPMVVGPDQFGEFPDYNLNTLKARFHNADGTVSGSELTLVLTLAAGRVIDDLGVVTLATGGFALVWLELDDVPIGTNFNWSTKAQFFNSAGASVVAAVNFASGTGANLVGGGSTGVIPDLRGVVELKNGGFAAVMSNFNSITAAFTHTAFKFNYDGVQVGSDSFALPTGATEISDIEIGQDGNVLISGFGANPGGGTALLGQYYDFQANTTNGTINDDTLFGRDGIDDDIRGDAGNDILRGGSGYDFLRGGLGNDIIDGGASDFDTADYASATGSITAALTDAALPGGATGGSSSGADGNDTLIDIENLRGGNSNDTLTGNSADNLLRGNLGNDILNGGAGSDTADYTNATSNVTVTLTDAALPGGATGGSSSGAHGVDTLIDIERIRGGSGNDTLNGNSGDNFMRGNAGNDTINGGAGFDWSEYSNATGSVSVTLTNAAAPGGPTGGSSTGGGGNDTLINIEAIRGSDFNDTLTGNDADNWLRGRRGDDAINGGAGYDYADYFNATGSVTATLTDGVGGVTGGSSSGADGNDTLSNIEAIRGGAFDDVLAGNNSNNTLRGGKGDDQLNGGGGNEDWASYVRAEGGVTVTLTDAISPGGPTGGSSSGADGNDTLQDIERISGSHFNDTLTGNSADNVLRGNRGDDITNGGAGSDYASYFFALGAVTVTLTDGAGGVTGGSSTGADGNDTLSRIENVSSSGFDDTLTGNSLDNILKGNAGNDILNGGGGNDTAAYIDATGNVTAILTDGAIPGGSSSGADGNDTFSNIDNLSGGDFNDTLTGNSLANVLKGGLGNDSLNGGGGNDSLTGEGGNDTLYFDSADGVVDGGLGTDIGIYTSMTSGLRNYDLAGHGLEELRWTYNGNTYVLTPTAGGTRTETVTDTAITEAFLSRTTLLDALFRVELEDIRLDAGNRIVTDYDASSSQPWNLIIDSYDNLNRLDFQDTRYDDNRRIIADQDQATANAWTTITTNYAPSGAVDYQDYQYDSGSRVIFDGDQDAAFNWTSITTTYSSPGVVDYQDYQYDDGRRVIFDSDQTNIFIWTTQQTSYALGGVLDVQDTFYDAGATWARQIFDWDQTSAFYWKYFESFYNAAGMLKQQRITRDDDTVIVFNY